MKITTGLLSVLVVGFLGLVAAIVILSIMGRDPVAFVANVGTLLTAIAGFVVLIRSQQKQGNDIATVKANTNGTLSKLSAQLAYALAKLDPAHAAEVMAIGADVAPVIDAVAPIIEDVAASRTVSVPSANG